MRQYLSMKAAGIDDSDAQQQSGVPAVTVREADGKIVIDYTFAGVIATDRARTIDNKQYAFRAIRGEGFGSWEQSGRPMLPAFARLVQIPPGHDFKLAVKVSDTAKFSNLLVAPAQVNWTDDPRDPPVFEFDRAFYDRDELYPRNAVEVSAPFEVDGYRAVMVTVMPCQYNPARRELVGHGNVQVTLSFTARPDAPSDAIPPEVSRDGYGNMFLNPGRNIAERLNLRVRPPFILPLVGPELLIVYHPSFKAPATRLAAWKNHRGLITEAVALDAIVPAGGDPTTLLKGYLRERRGARFSRLRYVMLMGDVQHIPTSVPGGANLTDHYYATKVDATAAEPVVLPWLAIGRLAANDAAQADSVVDEIIAYERNPPANPAYYRRMTFAALFQDADGDHVEDRAYLQTLEDIRTHLIGRGFAIQRAYVRDGSSAALTYLDGTPVPPDVMASFMTDASATATLIAETAEGQLVMAHRDHGSEDGWYRPPFSRANLAAINTRMPTIFFSVNCLTGRFNLTAPQQCFAEVNLDRPAMAPSIIAATRVSGTFRNNSLMKGLFDALWPGVLPAFPAAGTVSYPVKANRIGDVLNYAKAFLLVAHPGDTSGIRDHLEIYHVLGDPTLEIWKDPPRANRLRVSAIPRSLTTVQVTVSLDACPAGSVLTVWDENDRLVKRLELTSNTASFLLPGRQPLPPVMHRLAFCYKAPGFLYEQQGIRIP